MKGAFTRAAAAVLILCASSPAWAQTDADSAAAGNLVLTTTTSGGLTSTGITVGVVLTLMNTGKSAAALERYLNENRADVLASVSGGAGGAGEDLATMFGVSGGNRVRFVAALRADRQGLGDVLGQRDIDREGAEVFMGRVIDLMRADDALSADLPEKLLRI